MNHKNTTLTLTLSAALLTTLLLLLNTSHAATTPSPSAPSPQPPILINELDAQTPGTDVDEFLELYDGGLGNTPLDGLILVLFNGGSTDNPSYRVIDLGGHTTDENGYLVVGNAAVPNVDVIIGNGALQNGPDAAAIYSATVENFPNGTPVTSTNLIDAIVYDDYNDDDPELRAILLNPDQPMAYEADSTSNASLWSTQRCPNGSGGPRNTSTYYPGNPTPGTANNCPAAPNLVITKTVQANPPIRLGDPITYVVTIANHEDITYTIHVTDVLPDAVIGANLDQIADVPAHDQVAFTLPATVRTGSAGLRGQTITNTAHLSYTFQGTLELFIHAAANAAFTIASDFKIYLPTVLRN